MQTDIKGRTAKIHLGNQRALWPLFEAVVNSIHAIHDTGNGGSIQIHVLRALDMLSTATDPTDDRAPITGFKIIDNGVGFTAPNFLSFRTADSRFKEARGGKGIGRFTWLKAFEKAEIESYFNGGDIRFEFSLEHPDGVKVISENSSVPTENRDSLRTMVTLIGLNDRYRQWIPADAAKIALKVLYHCLPFFLLKKIPNIKVMDTPEGSFDLNEMFDQQIRSHTEGTPFNVGAHTFHISHARLFSTPSLPSVVTLCADRREVQQIPIDKIVKGLPSSLVDGRDGEYFYVGVVEGAYLDANNNSERGGFNFAEPDEVLFGELTKEGLTERIADQVRLFLSEPLQLHTASVQKRAENIIRNQMPECRTLVSRLPEHIEELASARTESQLKTKINEIYYRDQIRVQEEAGKLLKSKGLADVETAKTEAERIITEVTGLTQDALAKYVAYRKTIIELFEKRIRIASDGAFHKESEIHGLFFPMKTTSENVNYEAHNLWLIDERMAFHEYLSSDVGMPRQGKKGKPSDPRPDMLVLNNLGLFGVDEIVQDGALVEFKKPEREDYSDKENPIQQIYRYVHDLRSGKVRANTGRHIIVNNETRFIAFIIADITPKLEQFAKDAGVFFTVEPKMRVVGYHPEYGVYIEILSLQKVLDDAKKRNRVLFRKLGLPT
ncbi:MAG TPA: ATP-binding protein [Verrucomicrobiales bacterium]|nr:ATP-binding protein [Verrucomicrobiales bacterium]